PLRDPVGDLAAQHVHEVHRTEALAGAVDGGERLARGLGGVPGLRRLEASIAIAARHALFAEVVEQPHAPASGRLAQAEERIELRERDAAEFLAAFALFHEPAQLYNIAEAVGHPGVGRLAVASGAAGLLVVALDAL